MSGCESSPPQVGEVIFKRGDEMFRRKGDGTVEPFVNDADRLDTPPTPERRIADLEERLRNAIAEREGVIAKSNARADDLIDVIAKLQGRLELAENSQRQGATWHHWTEIAAMPQVWISDRQGGTCHESVMRSFHVAEEVRRLLELGTPVAVVLQVMDLLENRGRS